MEKNSIQTELSAEQFNSFNIGIVAGESADLPQEIIGKYQIAIVPFKLIWPEIENLPGENTFQKMRELEKKGIKSFGKTSQPSPKDYLDKFEHQLARFSKVICITPTSKLSGSYNSALQAKKFLKAEDQERVFVVDSLGVSVYEALLIFKAIKLIEEGKRVTQIAEELEKLIPQVRCYLIFDDPKWVEAAGRISSLLANLIKGMMRVGIRPLLTFKNGELSQAGLKTEKFEVNAPKGVYLLQLITKTQRSTSRVIKR